MGSLVRLNAALDWVDVNDRLADIGCDHGYLAIEALNQSPRSIISNAGLPSTNK